MGNEMKLMGRGAAAAIAATAAFSTPSHAEGSNALGEVRPAAGVELSASTDSDKTSVIKLLGRALWRFDGRDSGIDVERAWFAPQGQHTRTQTRVYLELADTLAGKWKWSARVGTNGSTVLGSASMHSTDWSKEFFVEREIVETPRGVDEGIYYTFAGASANLISTDRDTVSTMVGVQKFTGRNVRYHLRGTAVHVLDKSLGLSVQLQGRYFRSTLPGEFDYYSPRNFVQLIPVLQMRRFTRTGWMYLAAAGYGAQTATGSGWQGARLARLRLESPASSKVFQAFAQAEYANSSLVGAASDYNYVLGRVGLTARF